ncbi:MAG: 5-methylcytosine restriction system specificity protein McrC [Bacillota bacterium]
MTVLKIKDNTLVGKKYFGEVSRVTGIIADKTLEQLEKEGVFIFPELVKDSEDITGDQVILQSVNDYYRSGNIMGFLGYGNERLVIESRFSTGECDYFFQYLLERVLNFPNILDLDTDTNQDNLMLNLLLFLFPHYLREAMRKGPFKTYIKNQYNDGNVKGTIDIARHVRKNTPFIGNVAYNQREFSYDNYLIHLIRHTIEFIKRKPFGNSLLQKAKDEVALVIRLTNSYEFFDRRKVIAENIKNPIRHAYYREYRALQRLCIMILRYEKHQIGSGMRQIHGILFDGAWLWEEYVSLLIGSDFYHPMNKSGKGAQRLFAGNIGLIYPDFISRDADNRIIADAKYKPEDNIKSNDYQQLLAYMFRFDAKKGLYFYPQNRGIENIELRMNRGSTYENNVCPRDDVIVIKCGLVIPDDSIDYSDFKMKIKKSEETFRTRVLSSLKYSGTIIGTIGSK